MKDGPETDLQEDAGFAIPAQHARRARIKQVTIFTIVRRCT